MKIIFVRHGDPDYEHDTLTEKGIREAKLLGSLTLNHLKISRKARNGFIFCQILIFILHVTYKYCIMHLRWHK